MPLFIGGQHLLMEVPGTCPVKSYHDIAVTRRLKWSPFTELRSAIRKVQHIHFLPTYRVILLCHSHYLYVD